jgi:hypothetical protein
MDAKMTHDISSTIKYVQGWNDEPSLDRLKKSHKSLDVQKSNAENHLKNVALRFQYAPNQSTLALWAKDIIDSGCTDDNLETVCKSIPFKFEKMPTLNQIMELLRPYMAKASVSVDELSDLSHRCYFHLKDKFMTFGTQEQLTGMCKIYADKIFPASKMFNAYYQEMLVLNDWLRSYFKKGEGILQQGLVSNEAFKRNDKEYFTRPLRNYAKEHNL